jgi:membrane-bound lytic murein transglycosylase A
MDTDRLLSRSMLIRLILPLVGFGLAGGLVPAGSLAQRLPSTPSPAPSPTLGRPQKPVPPLQRTPPIAQLGLDDQLLAPTGDRPALLTAIDRSLRYLQTPAATIAYQRYPVRGVTRDRVERSLRRFRQLLVQAQSAEQLQTAVQREFEWYQSTGKDGQGTVAFTAYFEPVYPASRIPTATYRYPLYRLPAAFSRWPQPHPTRLDLEGRDGLAIDQGHLKGTELVWLADRLTAFLVQVQGSARLQLTDGSTLTVGVAALTNHPYTSIGKELVKDGKFRAEELTLPKVLDYFQQHPADLNDYLPRNQRFVFFKNTEGAPAIGSLGVPVTPERSIATDKSLMPPGALALIQAPLPAFNALSQLEQRPVSLYVLDQDTGGAIKGAGRVDIFMGTGKKAGEKAGLVNANGKLYYLLLK